MKTFTIILGTHYEEYVKSKIEEGKYKDEREMICAALQRLEEEETRQVNLKNSHRRRNGKRSL